MRLVNNFIWIILVTNAETNMWEDYEVDKYDTVADWITWI